MGYSPMVAKSGTRLRLHFYLQQRGTGLCQDSSPIKPLIFDARAIDGSLGKAMSCDAESPVHKYVRGPGGLSGNSLQLSRKRTSQMRKRRNGKKRWEGRMMGERSLWRKSETEKAERMERKEGARPEQEGWPTELYPRSSLVRMSPARSHFSGHLTPAVPETGTCPLRRLGGLLVVRGP